MIKMYSLDNVKWTDDLAEITVEAYVQGFFYSAEGHDLTANADRKPGRLENITKVGV